MTAYEYTHLEDGRRGVGYSVWSAILKALGPADTGRLGTLRELDWSPWGDGNGRTAAVYTHSGRRLGLVKEVRS